MKAQFVFEKFEEESDPIHDMGIGEKGIWDNLRPGMVFELMKDIPNLGPSFYPGLIIKITKVEKNDPQWKNYPKRIYYDTYRNMKNYHEKIVSHSNQTWGWNFDFMKNFFKFIELKESVNEKFEEESDPIHDMSIGDPLLRAGGALQKYAEKNGYEFVMRKIAGVESPVMIMPIKPKFDTVPVGSYRHHAPCMYTKIEYTITYMKHRQLTPFSLRKNWIGYLYELNDDDYDRMDPKISVAAIQNWELNIFKQHLKKGDLKEGICKQALLGRYKNIPDIMERVDKNIKTDIKKGNI